jgi:photosystem II stability/assembly factor-like uncharacterized protein
MTRRFGLLVCAALLAACNNQAVAIHTASKSPAQAVPSNAAAPASPTRPPADGNPLSLATIQRLDASTGFVTGWTGTGLGLARTLDSGASWHQIAVPTDRITSLRFIDANVGWVAGSIPRNVAQVACAQTAPPGSSACYGVVLRTQDGGKTWQKALDIPNDGVNGDPIVQIQAIDAQVAWALTLACGSPPAGILNCPTDLRRTSDAGQIWTTLVTGQIVSMRFATASRGWLALDNKNGSEVRFTNDGGLTWVTGLQTGSSIVGLDTASPQTAWVMTRDGGYCTSSTCTKYELFRTLDGGSTWTSLGNPKPSTGGCAIGAIYGPLFASPTRGWLALNLGAGGVAGPGGLMQTDDGGKTWRCMNTPPNTYLVSAADPAHVWVASNRREDNATTLYSSDDGGTTWHPLDLSSLANGPVAPR